MHGRPFLEAMALATDPAWTERLLAWFDGFHQEHGHGPAWSVVRAEASLWPQPTPERLVCNVGLRHLGRHGLLDGLKTPYALRRRQDPEMKPPRQRPADEAVGAAR